MSMENEQLRSAFLSVTSGQEEPYWVIVDFPSEEKTISLLISPSGTMDLAFSTGGGVKGISHAIPEVKKACQSFYHLVQKTFNFFTLTVSAPVPPIGKHTIYAQTADGCWMCEIDVEHLEKCPKEILQLEQGILSILSAVSSHTAR